MSRTNFENELRELHVEIIEMGSFVENAIEAAVKAFMRNDKELCKKVIKGDKKVDAMEKAIESRCLWLIAQEQPIASDLRKITTALRIAPSMERIGDNAANIAELTLELGGDTFAKSSTIPDMATAVIEMVHDAITSYVNYDLELAKKTRKKDDEVDAYFMQIKQELVQVFTDQPQAMDNAIDFLLLAKYLERIADHAVIICEWIHFSQTGEHKNTLIF